MPQFEFEQHGKGKPVRRIRARDEMDAVLRLALCDDTNDVRILDSEDLAGWRTVIVDGASKGRIRLFQRMKFRRD